MNEKLEQIVKGPHSNDHQNGGARHSRNLIFIYHTNPFLDAIVREVEASAPRGSGISVIGVSPDLELTTDFLDEVEEIVCALDQGAKIVTDRTLYDVLTSVSDKTGSENPRGRELYETLSSLSRKGLVYEFNDIFWEQKQSREVYSSLYEAIARYAREKGIKTIAVVLHKLTGAPPVYRKGSLADHGIWGPEGIVEAEEFVGDTMQAVYEHIRSEFEKEGVRAIPAIAMEGKETESGDEPPRCRYGLLSSPAAIHTPQWLRFKSPMSVEGEVRFIDRGDEEILELDKNMALFLDRHALPGYRYRTKGYRTKEQRPFLQGPIFIKENGPSVFTVRPDDGPVSYATHDQYEDREIQSEQQSKFAVQYILEQVLGK